MEKVSERDHKESRAHQEHRDRQDHKAPQGYQARDCLGYQEKQGLQVLKATQGLENLVCQDCQENQEGLGYLDQKGNLVLMVAKDKLDFLGLQVSLVPLDFRGFQNQEVKGFPAS